MVGWRKLATRLFGGPALALERPVLGARRIRPCALRRRRGLAIGLTVGAFAIVLILVVVVVLVILGTMGGQIANVFSNVAAALNSTPSP